MEKSCNDRLVRPGNVKNNSFIEEESELQETAKSSKKPLECAMPSAQQSKLRRWPICFPLHEKEEEGCSVNLESCYPLWELYQYQMHQDHMQKGAVGNNQNLLFSGEVKNSSRAGTDQFSYVRQNPKWEESAKLCDYTHMNSYAYDFHLRTIEAYIAGLRNFHKMDSVQTKQFHIPVPGLPQRYFGKRRTNKSTSQKKENESKEGPIIYGPGALQTSKAYPILRHQFMASNSNSSSDDGGQHFLLIRFIEDFVDIHRSMPVYSVCGIYRRDIPFPNERYEFSPDQIFLHISQGELFDNILVFDDKNMKNSCGAHVVYSSSAVGQLISARSYKASNRILVEQTLVESPPEQNEQQQQAKPARKAPPKKLVPSRKNALRGQEDSMNRLNELCLNGDTAFSATFMFRLGSKVKTSMDQNTSEESLQMWVILTDSRSSQPRARLQSLYCEDSSDSQACYFPNTSAGTDTFNRFFWFRFSYNQKRLQISFMMPIN
ncbi:hypothetical protein Ciccas_002979 [Cichlidogyrus casuarinus]|uniref:Uncharacterized protein n=1 Tax=Cichlidogyrus casuarinus TaxID=1844966 RepID=A0ABD2QG36_9PLAT